MAPVIEGLPHLSARQREVLRLMSAGKPDKVIGARMGITRSAVCTYKNRIRSRLGIGSSSDLRIFATGIQWEKYLKDV